VAIDGADTGSNDSGDNDDVSVDEAAAPAASGRRPLRLAMGAVALLVVAGVGFFGYRQIQPVVSSQRYRDVTYKVPEAPQLSAKAGETVYRIDPTASSLTYEVQEKFAKRDSSKAKGVTNGIAGDLAINTGDLAASRVGEIVVNVEQFHSDNNLRDARIRQDFLSSHEFPLARLEVTEVEGLDGALEEGREYSFTMTGDVTIKETTEPADFDVTASVEDGKVTATATTKTKLSTFDAGPISIAGLVSTEDEVTLTLKLTALDPAEHDIPTEITGPGARQPDPDDSPSFEQAVQPILENNCVGCHATGQMAGMHLPLDDAGDAAAISDGIRTVTENRYMPPWPASDKGVPLAHKTTLSDKDLATLADWSDAGGPLDVPESTKLKTPKAVKAQQPRHDVVPTRPPYTGSEANLNDYRCFVLDPGITETKVLTGYEFLPDVTEILHHAQVFHVSDQQAESSKRFEEAGGQPGWSCYGGISNLKGRWTNSIPGRTYNNKDVGFAGQNNLVAGWVPGQSPVIFPESSGIYMHPGDKLVLQLHYNYTHGTFEPDESSLALQFDDADAGVKGVRVVNPLAPVEIPCPPGNEDEPLCDRAASIVDYERLYGKSGSNHANGLLTVCDRTAEEMTKDFDGTVARSTCDLKVPEDGVIIGAMGHMHTIGSSFRMTLDEGTDDEQILLDIPTWSFDWQMNYQFEKPLEVKAGQTLKLECTFDRSLDPLRPPRYIVFNEGTEDEMCFGTYSLIPKNQGG
jgi:polyisoprenoid-binding protein YceI